jgi:EmrB/QacA subfamily drug resistance transporter
MNRTVNKSAVLWISMLGSFLTPFLASSLNVALPVIGKEFAMNAVLLGWVSTAYLLTAAAVLVPCGKLGDIYGRKRILRYGVYIYTTTALLLTVTRSAGMLLILRVAQGVGDAMIFGTALAILTSVFHARERGQALGLNTAAVYLGLSLGPLLGGLISGVFGWRGVFFVNVPLGLLLIFLVNYRLPGEWFGTRGEKFDIKGSALYGLMLLMLVYGASILPARQGFSFILAGTLLLAIFVWNELRSATPLLPVRLFTTNKLFGLSNLAALINYSATAAVAFLLSLYLQYLKGLSPEQAGSLLTIQPVIMMLLSPLAGRLSDRIEPRLVASLGMGVTFLGIFFLTFLTAATPLYWVALCLGLLGMGFGIFSAPNTNAVMSSVKKNIYGVASATLGTMRLLGQMLSMGIALLVFSLIMGKVQITPSAYGLFLKSTRTLFQLFSIFCFFGIFASLARRKC